METQKPEIYERMAKVMAEIAPVAKERKNSQQGYSFRGIDDMYNAVQPIMAKHGIFCAPEYDEPKINERNTQRGGVLFYCHVRGRFTFYAADGSSVQCTTVGEAMDSGDKASNKAMSAAYKYALMQVFCIPTDDPKDSENDTYELQGRHAPQPPAEKPATPPTQPDKHEAALPEPVMPDDLDAEDAYSDDGYFEQKLTEAFSENHFPPAVANGIIKSTLHKKSKAYGTPVLELKHLRLKDRHAFIDAIEGGLLDRFKQSAAA